MGFVRSFHSSCLLASSLVLALSACSDDGVIDLGDSTPSSTSSGDGDGDPATGDGDGDPTTTTGDGDGDPTTTTGDGDGDPTTTGDGDGDDPGCSSNADCPETDVCVDNLCEDANLFNYEIRVLGYTPPDCGDGIGSAEIAYYAYGDEVLLYESSESTCPAAWPQESFVYNPPEVFQIDFWELDTFADDLLIALCWQNEFDECTQIPKDILHEGELNIDSEGTEIEMVFIPIEP